jgi:hypothetical protein
MSIVINSKSGPDSKLHLEIPVSQPNADFVVEVVLHPQATARDLPPEYFEVLGSVDDETLVVHPQPAMPPAIELE